jgi:asparagine synthetase B (glutamine-hydrolysing)
MPDLALTTGAEPPARSRDGAWSLAVEEGGRRLWTSPGPYTARWEDTSVTLGHEPDHWLRVTWADGAWTVSTDRFGTIHAYAGDGVVSTFSPAAWGHDPPLDWLAVGGFARLGWYPGDRMPVAGVRLLRPDTDEVLDGGATRRTGWHHEPRTISEDDAVDEFDALLTEVLEEQVVGVRAGLPISGGLDSRGTVAALARGDVDGLWAYSYGYEPGSPELRIAGEVAAARGLDVEAIVVPAYLFAELEDVADATEALVDLTLCRQWAMAGALREHTDAVVAAHWGDVWFGLPAADASLLDSSTKRGHEWLTRHLVAPHLGHDPEPDLRDLLADEARRVAGAGDVRGLALKTEQWSLRWTEATLRAFAVEPRLPYYDPRLADFALSLPAELLVDRRLQIAHLRRCAPDLARIEWQAKETDLFRLRHERTWRLPARALRRVRRRLRPPTARLRNWEVQLLSPEGRAGVDRWLLEGGLDDVVERAEVEGLVADHRAAPTDATLGYAVSALLTFAVWKARFT